MTYLEEIREITKSSLEEKRNEYLDLAMTEIRTRAKEGKYNTIFYCCDTGILDFIASYLEKEGFSIEKHYYDDYAKKPSIKIEWKD